MRFIETTLAGAFIIEPEIREDVRGGFGRTFCVNEFAAHGLSTNIVQANLSFNHLRGTLRGLHYQLAPAAETKIIRCTSGAILDVIVDLRPESPTYLQHLAVELTAANRRALYVPKLFAHGYQTLTDGAEVTYQVDAPYAPGQERGLRYDDPRLAIRWPLPVSAISEKDMRWPLCASW